MPIELEEAPAVAPDPAKKKPLAPPNAPAPNGMQAYSATTPDGRRIEAGNMAPAPAPAPMTAPPAAPPPITPPAPTVAAPAAPVDRVALASRAFDTLQKSREPGDKRALEAVTSQAAGLGQLGSGQWRSALATANNERQLQLDTARDDLITKATEGSIADASTAYQQALAASQFGLAGELGRGNLDVSRGQLDLAKEGQSGSLDLQKQALAIEAAYKAGTMTLAEKDQALRELESERSNTRADAQLDLARAGQEATIGMDRERLGLAREGQEASINAEQKRIAMAAKQQELDEAYRTGQITLQEKELALRELAQSQGNENEQQRIGLAREQLAQTAAQFGASQAQQMELARLADKTQNRQIDVSTAQGQNALLLELARIMGGPSGNVDPNFLRAIAAAMGMPMANNPNGTTPSTSATNPYGINTSGLDTSGQDNPRPGGE